LRAAASLPAITPSLTRPHDEPLVLVDGYPEPRLGVTDASYDGPLDRRVVTLTTAWDLATSARARWQRGTVVVLLPHRLSDDEVRSTVLAAGELTELADHEGPGQRHRRFQLRDSWQQTLEREPSAIPWVDPAGELVADAEGRFALGERPNRSGERFPVGGEPVHVFQQDGKPWTVGTALATLSAIGGLELALAALPNAIADQRLPRSLDLAEPIGALLEQLLTETGLLVQRTVEHVGGHVRERRAVRPITQGRPVPVRWPSERQPLSDVQRIDRTEPARAARPWIAQGGARLIESTFELVGGWDPTLAGEADSEYGRTTSSDFSRFANVYRHWVLNEDGAFTGEPYDRGERFDLTSFFDDARLRPQPLRFRACVTLDDTGERLPPIVEVSTDGGSSWSRYAGESIVADTRAAVYLNDATLPAGFLSAAQSGEARVRVTASLRSPRPVAERRWRGNPFAGQQSPRVFDLSDTFRFQRVAQQSIHRAAIDAGTLDAAEVNQRDELRRWLIDRMERAAVIEDEDEADGEATLILNGAWPMLRIGDQLMNAGGEATRLDQTSQRIRGTGARVESVRLHFPVDQGQGPSTTVRVRF